MGWGGLFWRDRGLNGVSTKEEQGLLMGGLCSAVTWGMVPLWVCLGAPGGRSQQESVSARRRRGEFISLISLPFSLFHFPLSFSFGLWVCFQKSLIC